MSLLKYLVIIEKLRQSVAFWEHEALLQLQKLIKLIGLLLHLLQHLVYCIINTYVFMVVIISNMRRISTYVLPRTVLANALLLILAVQVDLLVVNRADGSW